MSLNLRTVLRHVLSVSILSPAIAAGACSGATVDDVADAGGDGGGVDGGGTDGGGACTAPNKPMWTQPGCGRAADRCITPDTPLPACYGVVCGCSGKVVSGCGGFFEPYVNLPGSSDPGAPFPAEGSPCDPGATDAGTDARTDAPIGCATTPSPIPDAGLSCTGWNIQAPCTMPDDAAAFDETFCMTWCGPNGRLCSKVDAVTLNCNPGCAVGRRPEGHAQTTSAREGRASEITGVYFAAMAELEAASVFSFERLARELEAHGAPLALRERAERAAEDERRHARVAGALATSFGGKVTSPAACPMTVRPLREVARENAVEGCVRETFGALTATLQAERARDLRVRKAMERIAADETAHAELAWDVAAWIETQLDEADRAALREAQAEAVRELGREVCVAQPASLSDVAGLPRADEAGRMLAAMVDALRLPRDLAA